MRPKAISPEQREDVIAHGRLGFWGPYNYFRSQGEACADTIFGADGGYEMEWVVEDNENRVYSPADQIWRKFPSPSQAPAVSRLFGQRPCFRFGSLFPRHPPDMRIEFFAHRLRIRYPILECRPPAACSFKVDAPGSQRRRSRSKLPSPR